MSPEEPGRHVTDTGRIVYSWPPSGRFADLWARIVAAFPDEEERCEAMALLDRWVDETSTLVAIGTFDEDGRCEWEDVEPDWSTPAAWLRRP